MARRIACVLVLVLCSLITYSCTSPAGGASSGVEFKDQLGRTVCLDGLPQRIISLAPSHTEILFALGLGDRVVGVTDYCNYPPEAKQKPSIGGFSTPNIEKIISLSPDLILAGSIHQKQVIPLLESRGMTIFVLAPETINGVLDTITLVGQITGKDREAVRLVADMESKIKKITDRTKGIDESRKPGVFYVTWHDPLKTAGAGTLQDELIRTAGGTNVAGSLSGYPGISLEAVILADPAVVIAGVGMGAGADAPLQFARTEPRLKDIAARKSDRIYPVNTDLVGRTGPRITDALEQFAGFIHPELFGAGK